MLRDFCTIVGTAVTSDTDTPLRLHWFRNVFTEAVGDLGSCSSDDMNSPYETDAPDCGIVIESLPTNLSTNIFGIESTGAMVVDNNTDMLVAQSAVMESSIPLASNYDAVGQEGGSLNGMNGEEENVFSADILAQDSVSASPKFESKDERNDISSAYTTSPFQNYALLAFVAAAKLALF